MAQSLQNIFYQQGLKGTFHVPGALLDAKGMKLMRSLCLRISQNPCGDIIMFKDQKSISSCIKAFRKKSILGQGGEVRTCGLDMCGLYQNHNTTNSIHYLLTAYLWGEAGNILGSNHRCLYPHFTDKGIDSERLGNGYTCS